MKAVRLDRREICKGLFYSKNKKQEQQIAETLLRHCISNPSLSRNKSSYGELQSVDLEQRLAQLEKENLRLKEMIIELNQENRALSWIIEKRC
ncbi:MAG TPA: hypothetical protein VN426_14830 [Syntrophomonadaceae bacterium]|nr:hypothetical protein [Syntrophomonadaceae bacterium]